jgi:hypothetical protein
MMTPPPPPGAATGKKGLPPLAWAGIGCGGLILLTVLAGGLLVGTCAKKGIQMASELAANPGKAAAEMMVTTNPTIEKVSEDETAGTMTIRLKASGETVTLSYEDLALGQIPVSGVTPPPSPGDLAKIPAWVPRYPGAADEAALFHVEDNLRVHGMLIARTTDDYERVADFFKLEAGKLSLDSSASSSMNLNGTRSFSLKFKDEKRELAVMAFGKSGDPLVIQTTYRELK